jgi:hypothetical protein
MDLDVAWGVRPVLVLTNAVYVWDAGALLLAVAVHIVPYGQEARMVPLLAMITT